MFNDYLYSFRAVIDYYRYLNDKDIDTRVYYANCALMHLRNFILYAYYDNMSVATKYYSAFKVCVGKVVCNSFNNK